MNNLILRSCFMLIGWMLLWHSSRAQDVLVTRVNEQQIDHIVSTIDQWRKDKLVSWKDGLETLPDSVKREIVRRGEEANKYEWPSLKAMTFLDFKNNGNRTNYENAVNERRNKLGALVKAEVIEGKGRFIPQIVNGLWLCLEETSWVSPAHLVNQQLGIGLPNAEDPYIDLGAGRMSVDVAVIYFLLHQEFDKVSKHINPRIIYELKKRTIEPYLTRDDFWWMNFKSSFVNNWNIWVNTNVLKTFLLIETDKHALKQGIDKVMRSADKFINFYPEDGVCDEGPSYWMHAGGELGIMMKWLKDVAHGQVSFADVTKAKNIGQYIINTNISGNRYVNFADANAIEYVDPMKLWNFYEVFGDVNFAKYASRLHQTTNPSNYGMIELMEYAVAREDLSKTGTDYKRPNKFFYESLGQIILNSETKNSKMFFAAIGGHNGVSHNHNDVGSFMLYVDDYPVLLDVGVGTYNAKTFSSKRYEIWNMQSQWHNLPIINGVQQKDGRKYRAEQVKTYVDGRNQVYSLDISKAYLEEAGVNHWIRQFSLDTVSNKLSVSESYDLKEVKGSQQLIFVTQYKPIVKGNVIQFSLPNSEIVEMNFATKSKEILVDNHTIEDPRIVKVWGDMIYRIHVDFEPKKPKGMISYSISKK